MIDNVDGEMGALEVLAELRRTRARFLAQNALLAIMQGYLLEAVEVLAELMPRERDEVATAAKMLMILSLSDAP